MAKHWQFDHKSFHFRRVKIYLVVNWPVPPDLEWKVQPLDLLCIQDGAGGCLTATRLMSIVTLDPVNCAVAKILAGQQAVPLN